MITDTLMDFLKKWEGCKLTVYKDVAGYPTVGVGHMDKSLQPGDTITQEQADEYLKSDIEIAQADVDRCVTVDLTQNQKDALTSFVFNLGSHALVSSTLLRCLNKGNYDDAACEFVRWDRAGGQVVTGLLQRRLAEAALFRS